MIFYFTATGNSLFIAERIAATTNDRIVDIASCVKNDDFTFELENNEPIGIITPVYFRGAQMIVVEFLQRLSLSGEPDAYRYVVLNSGGKEAGADKFITSIFRVDAVFDVVTVSNYSPSYMIDSQKAIDEKLDEAELRIDAVSQLIQERKAGIFKKYAGRFAYLFSTIAYFFYKHDRSTKKFAVNENCIGCRKCEKVCPRSAIEIENKKPVWTARKYEICLSCLHHCPVSAISYGKESAGNGQYLNPRVQYF